MNDYGYLAHHGIMGQKWGIRRYQNEDGTLTPEGKKRYGVESISTNSHDILRRIGARDYGILNPRRFGQMREFNLEKRINKLNSEKNKYSGSEYYRKLTELTRKYNAQKNYNIDMEKRQSTRTTTELLAKRFLIGFSGSRYSDAMSSAGYTTGKSALMIGGMMADSLHLPYAQALHALIAVKSELDLKEKYGGFVLG
jgi:hypothetical protein